MRRIGLYLSLFTSVALLVAAAVTVDVAAEKEKQRGKLPEFRSAIEETVEFAQRELGDKWTAGMHPEIPEVKILENPYQYTEWDAGAAQWKR